jgi:hypothetical protein
MSVREWKADMESAKGLRGIEGSNGLGSKERKMEVTGDPILCYDNPGARRRMRSPRRVADNVVLCLGDDRERKV